MGKMKSMYIDDLENIHKDGIAKMSDIRRVIRGMPKRRGFKQPVRVVKKTQGYTFGFIQFSQLTDWDLAHHNYADQFAVVSDSLQKLTPKQMIDKLREIVKYGGIIYNKGGDWYDELITLPLPVVQAVAETVGLEYQEDDVQRHRKDYERRGGIVR